MGEGASPITAPTVVGVVLVALGALLTGIHLFHGLEELADSLSAVLTGAVLPLSISLVLLGSGAWILRRDWALVSPWRLLLWVLAGIAVAEVLAALLYGYQATHDIFLDDIEFVFAMHVSYGAVVGLLVGLYDLRVRETRARLRRKTQRLDNFASIVSHDLRNPLNVVEGRLELATDTGDLSHLDPLEDAVARMRTIIRETLTLARQGDDALSLQPVGLGTTARNAWSVIETDSATLEIETHRRIRADPDRLRALLENLFRNAVDHTDGAVTVSVGELSDGSGFYVADTGPGIPVAERDRVFEAGYSNDPEGTGLGLSIVRAAADSHGWVISIVESTSRGARFEFRRVDFAD